MAEAMHYSDVNILLVDDDRVDVLSITEALEENHIANPVHIARNGLEALQMLRGEGGIKQIEYPYLVLLDLNMPKMSGIEFLKEIRNDPKLERTVVFVLTTSDDDRDKVDAYKHHVAGYLVKSKVGQDFMHLIEMLRNYKLLVKFPTG